MFTHLILYINFFFSKKVFKCHSCRAATSKHINNDAKLNHAKREFVDSLILRISSSLESKKYTVILLVKIHKMA